MKNELYQDASEETPFPAIVSGKKMLLTKNTIAVSLFRHRPNVDYLAVRRADKNQAEYWTMIFDRHNLIYWMADLALSAYERENVRRANSSLGSFAIRYGWNPDVVIEDYPNEAELETYLEYCAGDINSDLRTLQEAEDGKAA